MAYLTLKGEEWSYSIFRFDELTPEEISSIELHLEYDEKDLIEYDEKELNFEIKSLSVIENTIIDTQVAWAIAIRHCTEYNDQFQLLYDKLAPLKSLREEVLSQWKRFAVARSEKQIKIVKGATTTCWF